MAVLRLVALLALAQVSVGCFNPTYSDATLCATGGACPAGRLCVDGHCLRTGGSDGGGAQGDAASGPRLRLVKMGEGAGNVNATSGATLGCDVFCPSVEVGVTTGTTVTLEAFPQSGSYFQGFTGACEGPRRTCRISVNSDGLITVNARFAPIEHNLIFVSSTKVPGDFGGVKAADAICAEDAEESGLRGTFVALLAGGGQSAMDHLLPTGGALSRGFVRVDGLPVADTAIGLIIEHRMWYPPTLTQDGEPYSGQVWTGSDSTGLDDANQQCSGWMTTLAAATGATGLAGSGPLLMNYENKSCGTPLPFLCVMQDKSAPTSPSTTPGKKIFVSDSGLVVGAGFAGATTACRSGGSANAVPFLALEGTSAASRLSMATVYVRPDGIRVGTGAQIAAGELETGIWVTWAGVPTTAKYIWTGSTNPKESSEANTATCDNWNDKSAIGGGIPGLPTLDPKLWWWTGVNRTCGNNSPVYCVEP